MNARFFLTIFIIAFLTSNNAQAQFTFGVRAGLNCSNILSGSEPTTAMKFGFQAGAVTDYAVKGNFSVETGLFVSTMGHKLNATSATRTENPIYLQIPLHARYSFGNKFFVRGGPYFGFCVGGKGNWNTDEYDYKLNFGREEIFGQRVYRSFDFGLSAGAGMQFGNIQAGVECKQGLTNAIHSLSYKNLAISLTVAYMFGKKRKNITANANNSVAVEFRDHFKNGAQPKSLTTSRINKIKN